MHELNIDSNRQCRETCMFHHEMFSRCIILLLHMRHGFSSAEFELKSRPEPRNTQIFSEPQSSSCGASSETQGGTVLTPLDLKLMTHLHHNFGKKIKSSTRFPEAA